ncbi:MAG TPA: DNA repair protein RecN, partial [Actinomycetota bacterium]|nr:DNA repair protein RecN [Actinomycetota bacterium]
MLVELVVAGLGAIDRAEVKLGPGCTALTGETGAGKTLLVAAVGLLAGARGDRGLIREGQAEASVEGRFMVPRTHPAALLVAELGFQADDAADPVEVVLTRSIATSGSRARVNGRLATLTVLSELGGLLIEIASQHEHQRLASTRSQRALLDAFGGPDVIELAGKVEAAVRAAVAAARELEELEASRRERERELDVLRYEVAEIEGAALQEGESDDLKTVAARLEHAEEIAGASRDISRLLTGESGVTDSLVQAQRVAEKAASLDGSFGTVAERLQALVVEADDVAQDVVRREVAPDPAALAATRERLDQI